MNSDIIPIEIINLSSTNIPISTNIQSLDYQIGVSGVNNELIEVAVKDNVVVGDLPYYEGNYDVIPGTEEQVLPTTQHSMSENVIIRQIPVSIVSNLQGGLTATIG